MAILSFLGRIRRDGDLEGVVDVQDVIEWISRQINLWTGVPETDIWKTVVRLASNESLDGWPDRPGWGVYGKGREDLSHVAAPLHELDRDGTTARLWRELCRKWPVFGKAFARLSSNLAAQAAKTQAAATEDAESGSSGMSVEEANEEALKQAKKWGAVFFSMSNNRQAKLIGCHPLTWRKTQLYKTAVEQGKINPPKPKRVKALSFTRGRASVIGQGKKDEVLNLAGEREEQRLKEERELLRLTAQSQKESKENPSPTDVDPPDRKRKVHSRTRP
jgi:hypothetical protein